MRQYKILDEVFELTKGDLVIKVFINFLEHIFNLLLGLVEPQSRQQCLDLWWLNRTTLVLVVSIKNFLKLFDQVFGEVVLLDLHVLVKTEWDLEVHDVDFFSLVWFEKFEDFIKVLLTQSGIDSLAFFYKFVSVNHITVVKEVLIDLLHSISLRKWPHQHLDLLLDQWSVQFSLMWIS